MTSPPIDQIIAQTSREAARELYRQLNSLTSQLGCHNETAERFRLWLEYRYLRSSEPANIPGNTQQEEIGNTSMTALKKGGPSAIH